MQGQSHRNASSTKHSPEPIPVLCFSRSHCPQVLSERCVPTACIQHPPNLHLLCNPLWGYILPPCPRGVGQRSSQRGTKGSQRHGWGPPGKEGDGCTALWLPRPPPNHHPDNTKATSTRSPSELGGPHPSTPYLGGGMHGRLGGVNDEVAEGESEPPSLRALPQHHRLRAPPGEGPLQGRVVIRGRPISAARRRLWGQWGDVTPCPVFGGKGGGGGVICPQETPPDFQSHCMNGSTHSPPPHTHTHTPK